jgi:predicted molibdopterin-dependent oxidoreductase YjgC
MLQADRIVHTTCPYCGVGCQIDLHVKDGLIFRVNGRFDNDVNHGQLCVKGRFGSDFVHAPDRLRRPMVKAEGRRQKAEGRRLKGEGRRLKEEGRREKEEFRAVAWDEALAKVAGRLGQIRDQYGPDSIAFLTSAKCTNEENYLLQKFARAVIGTNNVDHCARL